MTSEDGRFAGRAADRAAWPGRKRRLGDDAGDDLSALTTAEDRLTMMWPLARRAWALAGRPLPGYRRGQAPGRILRRGVT
jgi:hypothetical protein